MRFRLTQTERLRLFVGKCLKHYGDKVIPRGLQQDLRVYPYVRNAPPSKTACELHEELTRNKTTVTAKTKINWHAVAVTMANKWLAKHAPMDLHETEFAETMRPGRVLLEKLAGAVHLNRPYIVMMWQGYRPNDFGVQVIENRNTNGSAG